MGTNRPSELPYANEATQASAPLTRKQKYALLVGILGSFYPGFAGSALNLAIPQMGADFGMGAAAVGWIITVYMLGVAATVVPFGKIADTTGRRRILLLGMDKKYRLLSFVFRNRKTSIPQLARVFGLDREKVKAALDR